VKICEARILAQMTILNFAVLIISIRKLIPGGKFILWNLTVAQLVKKLTFFIDSWGLLPSSLDTSCGFRPEPREFSHSLTLCSFTTQFNIILPLTSRSSHWSLSVYIYNLVFCLLHLLLNITWTSSCECSLVVTVNWQAMLLVQQGEKRLVLVWYTYVAVLNTGTLLFAPLLER
jgi:hypothetical protein